MKKRIMIVDDETDILISLKIFFENNNYEVITVKNGFDCIKELKKGFKGIVLMDIMMPKMDGWETIKKIVEKDLIKNIYLPDAIFIALFLISPCPMFFCSLKNRRVYFTFNLRTSCSGFSGEQSSITITSTSLRLYG